MQGLSYLSPHPVRAGCGSHIRGMEQETDAQNARHGAGLGHRIPLRSVACRCRTGAPLRQRVRSARACLRAAARAGAVSAVEGVRYWSVSSGDWRPLVTLSRALEGPGSTRTRPDFNAAEVLGGRKLYLAQRDGRSHGLNVYSMTALAPDRDRLVLTTVNETGIRFLVATLFEPRSLISVVTVTRLGGDMWGYYGLLVAKDGAGRGREASLVNRAAAFQRYLTGQSSDGAPPLAP